MKNEPVAIVGLITAAIALAVAFGAPVTDEQREAIIAFVVALIPVIAIIRSLVVAPATVEQKYQVKPGATPTEVVGIGPVR